MRLVEEIEAAIRDLSPEEFDRVAERVHAIEQERWDQQMDRDSAAGRLDFLRDEARAEKAGGLLKDWPPSS
jgi:hypothetical protein